MKTLSVKVLALLVVSTAAQARPSIETVCQSQQNDFSKVEVCAQVDRGGQQIYGYTITYSGGLLSQGSTVLAGGMRVTNGTSFNLFEGTSDLKNHAMNPTGNGSAYIGVMGGVRGETLSVYFENPNGEYDSRFGQNYNFQFN